MVKAQAPITVPQQLYIQKSALKKVETYTEYVTLVAKTKKGDAETRASYNEILFLTTGRDKNKTRVYNDLIPPQVLLNRPNQESSIQLESYITSITELYGESLTLTYSNFKVTEEIYYSQADSWYFVIVTADRKVDGVYQFGSEKIPYKTEGKIDFFVYASLINGQMKMGGIYGVQPHSKQDVNSYTKARIIKGDDDQLAHSTSKPLRINHETIKKRYTRGKGYTISWEGGLADDIIQVELVSLDTAKVKQPKTYLMLNSNKFNFYPSGKEKLGGKVKLGKYYFKVKNINTNLYTQSKPFKISLKIPLGLSIGISSATLLYLASASSSADIE